MSESAFAELVFKMTVLTVFIILGYKVLTHEVKIERLTEAAEVSAKTMLTITKAFYHPSKRLPSTQHTPQQHK